jgi:hypothetical protein
MPIKSYAVYYYHARCDGCNEAHDVGEDQDDTEQDAVDAGWLIFYIGQVEQYDYEAVRVVICPQCAARCLAEH